MDVKTEAHEYALKAMETELAKIEEAYIAGYEAGKKVGFKPIEIDRNGIEWVDLSLPSGTLWSTPLRNDKNHLLELPFKQAKDMDIPTMEDYEELIRYTEAKKVYYNFGPYHYTSLLSENGVEYVHQFDFWIKGEPDENKKTKYIDYLMEFSEKFIGEKVPVVLVKYKK